MGRNLNQQIVNAGVAGLSVAVSAIFREVG